ncbi:MAG: ribonuclease III [Epsilonproteobacteria bacterium]|nr:ribonuclease III [Campylobacterota bacterium]
MSAIEELEEKIGYSFKEKGLLIEALTHKSYKKPYNNERLEFLGDAVLDLIIGEYLFKKFPKSDEGILSKMRASLVNENGFALLAKSIQLGDFLLLSPAEENNNGREKSSLLSNAFEALMGAIYLEAGLEKVREIVYKLLEQNYPKIDLDTLCRDFKTSLQELTQANFGTTPEYVLLGTKGPDHKKEFNVAVKLNGETLATAVGKSKKQAQQKAAEIAYKKLQEEVK